jgi:YesN/AraC family two-component response regulator
MNYKAVIIDDETRGCLSLQKMLQHSCPEIEVAALAHSGAEGIEKINEHQPS